MIAPVMTYGIEGYWEDLSVAQFEMIDTCFCDFFKKVLGVSRTTRNRLVIIMCADLPLLTERLIRNGRVPVTPNYLAYRDNLEEKLSDVSPDFFTSPAMTQEQWKRSNYKKRHLVCRVSVHGFHYKVCDGPPFHEPADTCVCTFCNGSASSYLHVLSCPGVVELSLLDTW